MKNMYFSFALALFLGAVSFAAAANDDTDEGTAEAPKYKKHYPIKHMIITSNYESPRKLAEIARVNVDVPYILLPPEGIDNPIVFIPPKKGNSIEIKPEELSRFIAFVRPKNVIFLGGEKIVPETYRLAVPESIKTTSIDEPDWKVAALVLSDTLSYPKIQKYYAEYLAEKAQIQQIRQEIEAESLKNEKLVPAPEEKK